MARVLSENTYQRMMTSISTTEGLTGPSRAPSVRRVRTGGAASTAQRAYVQITTVTDAANYIGDVIAGPDNLTVTVAQDVTIKVIGATANAYSPGYRAFADTAKDSEGNTIYYLDGFLLS